MAKGIQVQLYDETGNAMSNESGIEVLWFDSDAVIDLSEIKGKSGIASTDSSGWLKLNIENVSGLALNEWGFLVCYKPSTVDYRNSPVFASRMQVTEVTGGTDIFQLTDWVRNPSWLALPSVTGVQKFAGLHAVYPESNFVALSATGAYTVNWGDGSGDVNVATGVTAERNIAWADAPPTSDVGIAGAQAVTFTDSGDLVNLTNHGWQNGQVIAFNSITSTTGISTYTHYRVFNKTTNSFQVSAIGNATDAALTLTTDGSGSIYVPQYRQVIVTVVPNGGNILTFNLHVKHSQASLGQYGAGWLDIVISFEFMTDLRAFVAQPPSGVTMNLTKVEQFSIEASDLRQCAGLFKGGTALRSVPKLVTSSSPVITSNVTFTDTGDLVNWTSHGFRNGDSVIFTSITSTTGIAVLTAYYVVESTANNFKVSSTYGGSAQPLTTNGSGTAVRGTDFTEIFSSCVGLQSVPFTNTSNVSAFTNMFTSCTSLQAVPALDTSSGKLFNFMFGSCSSLQTIPLLNTVSGITFSAMFSSCASLKSVPILNTSSGTNFSSMFGFCSTLKEIPLINTSLGTTFSGMFQYDITLETIPLINTSSGINLSSMFSNCTSLKSIPLLNTSACTDFSSMLASCPSLKEISHLNTISGTNFTSMFSGAYGLDTIPLLNTSAGTNFNSMFNNCSGMFYLPSINTSLATNITSMFTACRNLRSARLTGTPITISYAGLTLSPEALNEIYRGLKSGVTGQTITVSNNWGTASDDPTIATAKGWTVTG